MIAFAQIASFRFDKRSSSFQIESEKSNSRLEKSPFWKFWSTDLGSNGPDTNTETYIIGSVTRSKKSCQNISESCHDSFYLKSDVFKVVQIVTIDLGYFCVKIYG